MAFACCMRAPAPCIQHFRRPNAADNAESRAAIAAPSMEQSLKESPPQIMEAFHSGRRDQIYNGGSSSRSTMAGTFSSLGNVVAQGEVAETLSDADATTYANLLRSCSTLTAGKRLHAEIVRNQLDGDLYLRKLVVKMYVNCGSTADAWTVFSAMPSLDVIMWTRVIGAYNQKGLYKEALQVFRYMQLEGAKPDDVAFLPVLDTCAGLTALAEGRLVHTCIVEAGLDANSSLGNCIVNMYGKCGSLLDARKVFEELHERNVVSWTAMFGAYAQHGESIEALELFHRMQLEGVLPNRVAFVAVLSACSSPSALEEAGKIHNCILESGCELQLTVGNAIVNMYGKCGRQEAALEVFKRMPRRDVITWTAMVAAYAHQARLKEALRLMQQMQLEGVKPNKVTFVTILNSCENPSALSAGKKIHGLIAEGGLESETMVGNATVNMYAKCGSLKDAHMVFGRMPRRDVVTWNAIISAYAHRVHDREPLLLFQQMEEENVVPNNVTFVTVLYACARLEALGEGRSIHARVAEAGLESDVIVGTALVNLYAKCGCLEEARSIFESMRRDDVISWNAMISAYSEHDRFAEAMELLQRMESEGMVADDVTYISILNACSSPEALEAGRLMHGLILKRPKLEGNVVLGTAVLSMYVKCGSLEEAQEAFDGMKRHDVVSWTAMIGGYARERRCKEALQLFRRMQLGGVMPDKVILVIILSACSSLEHLAYGKSVHASVAGSAFEKETAVANAIVNMYGKCQCLEEARRVFDSMQQRDGESWTALVAAYAQQGEHKEVLRLFDRLLEEDLVPSKVAFVSAITACGNLGALARGREIHAQVEDAGLETHVIVATAAIYMYGKCGILEDARAVFDRLVGWRDLILWTAMIAAYAQNGRGKEALEVFVVLQQEGVEPDDVVFVAVLSACSCAGLADQGLGYFASMSMDYGIRATKQHFGCMIDLLGRVGRLAEAEVFIGLMPTRPDAVLWMSLLGGCRIHSDLERGKRIAQNVLDSDPDNAAAYVVLSDIHRTLSSAAQCCSSSG